MRRLLVEVVPAVSQAGRLVVGLGKGVMAHHTSAMGGEGWGPHTQLADTQTKTCLYLNTSIIINIWRPIETLHLGKSSIILLISDSAKICGLHYKLSRGSPLLIAFIP